VITLGWLFYPPKQAGGPKNPYRSVYSHWKSVNRSNGMAYLFQSVCL